jgi:hypothetical protein
VTLLQGLLVVLAGMAAGTINVVVGSGTLITFPVLLAIGLPPVTANVSNAVGLFPGSFVGAYGYRSELTGQRDRVIRLGVAASLGALVGAVLLLVLPASAFATIVPILIVLALVLVLIGPRVSAWVGRSSTGGPGRVTVPLMVVIFACGVYGGYFGAAQSVLIMGIFGLMLHDTIQRQNGLKNIIAGMVNAVAALLFVFFRHVDWQAAGLIAAGAIVGGVIGARVGKRLSPAVLRAVIVVIGVAALIKLLA